MCIYMHMYIFMYIFMCVCVCVCVYINMGFPGDSDGKKSACNAGDSGLIFG